MASDYSKAITSANVWLKNCLSAHASCGKRAQLSTIWSSDNMHIVHRLGVGDMMPRRLLRLESTSTPRVERGTYIFLEEFEKVTEEQPYVALSYCWGDAKSMTTTTTRNLESHKTAGLQIDSLPATFRDAIEVVRGLGYMYLWIDALCIIQDDEEDWKTEAPRMAVVYGNAVCTIHANDALHSDGGLFPTNSADARRDNLDTRAWTIQEQAISPRSLIFSLEGLRWECRQEQIGSNGSVLPPVSKKTGDLNKRARGLKEIFAFFRDWRRSPEEDTQIDLPEESQYVPFGYYGDPARWEAFLDHWWDLLNKYSSRRLTFESDRLVAINGIAAMAQRWAMVRNTWGLWMDFLEKELLWYVEAPGNQQTSEWLAPSWSWAATKTKGGTIRNAYHERDGLVRNEARLMMKPEIGIPYGTSFDQKLPIPAWRTRESQIITIKADLRPGEITGYLDADGNKCYNVKLNPLGRWSDEEVFDFRPDVQDMFPVGETKKIISVLFWHLDAEDTGMEEHVNMTLITKQRNGYQEIGTYDDDGRSDFDVLEERTLYRTGYMEIVFKEKRDLYAIDEDLMWKQVWLR